MLNYLHEMTRRDRESSFNGTFLRAFLEDTQEWRAFRVDGSGDNMLYGSLVGNRKSKELPLDAFDLTQPDLGMMWWKGDLYYVSRLPARQWRRGLRGKGLQVHKLEASGRSSKVRNPEHMIRDIALYFLEGNREHDNILSSNFGRRGKLLFFRNIPVGTIKGNVIALEFDLDINIEGYEICRK